MGADVGVDVDVDFIDGDDQRVDQKINVEARRYDKLESLGLDTNLSKPKNVQYLNSLLGEIVRLKQDKKLHLDYTVMKSNRFGRLVDVPAHSFDKAFRARLKKSNWIQEMLEVNSCGVAHINDGVRRIIQLCDLSEIGRVTE